MAEPITPGFTIIADNEQRLCADYEFVKQWMGKTSRVQAMARMWDNNGDALHLTKDYLLREYAEREEFTKEEYQAYKKGLDAFLNTFSQASAEIAEGKAQMKDTSDED